MNIFHRQKTQQATHQLLDNHAYQIIKHAQAPRSRLCRSRSCRQAVCYAPSNPLLDVGRIFEISQSQSVWEETLSFPNALAHTGYHCKRRGHARQEQLNRRALTNNRIAASIPVVVVSLVVSTTTEPTWINTIQVTSERSVCDTSTSKVTTSGSQPSTWTRSVLQLYPNCTTIDPHSFGPSFLSSSVRSTSPTRSPTPLQSSTSYVFLRATFLSQLLTYEKALFRILQGPRKRSSPRNPTRCPRPIFLRRGREEDQGSRWSSPVGRLDTRIIPGIMTKGRIWH